MRAERRPSLAAVNRSPGIPRRRVRVETAVAAGCLVVAYLVGGIPFGLLLARYGAGVDIRKFGSGNIGATNVARALGFKWGLAVLLLDAAKGIGPVLLADVVVPDDSPFTPHVRFGCGLLAIMGHVFPIWLGFRGGKGVATALGVVAVLAPLNTLLAFVGFAITVACGRYVALASVVASLVFAAAHFVRLHGAPFSAENWSGSSFALLVPLLIIVRHRGNLARLWAGTEPRFTFGSRTKAESSESKPVDAGTTASVTPGEQD